MDGRSLLGVCGCLLAAPKRPGLFLNDVLARKRSSMVVKKKKNRKERSLVKEKGRS